MNKQILILISTIFALIISATQAEVVIAGWDSWGDSITNSTASVIETGFSASLATAAGDWTRTSSGSTDLTFGVTSGALSSTDTATGALITKVLDAEGNLSYLQFTVTNDGTAEYELTGFHFDMQRQYSTSPRYYKVDVVSGSDITAGNLVNDQYLTATNPLDLDYADFDISLSNLTDNVLAAGESATFRLTITGGNDSARTFVDNIAITASPVYTGPIGPVIAGWDSWGDSITNSTASIIETGFSASLTQSAGDWTRTDSGSTDLTFGTEDGAGSSTNLVTGGLFTTVLDSEGNQSYLDFTVTNNSASNCTLKSFSFDMQRQYGTSPRYYRVDVVSGSDITVTNLVNDQYLIDTNPLDQNYADFDISLLTLDDHVLAPGESATFRLKITGGNDSARTFIDNVAIVAITETEPVTESAEIIAISPISASVVKLAINTSAPQLFYLKAASELTTNTVWSAVGQSTNGLAPFVETNLSYSTVSGTNIVIYVEADQDKKFFSIGEQ